MMHLVVVACKWEDDKGMRNGKKEKEEREVGEEEGKKK